MTALPKGASGRVFEAAVRGLGGGQPASFFVDLADEGRAALLAVVAALDGPAGARIHDALEAMVPQDHDEGPRVDVEQPSLPPRRRALPLLLRRARGRSEDAQRIGTPIHHNESFSCAHCGHSVVPAPGARVRNHCPRCLRSAHVDGPVPGDRASDCGGVMDPSSWSFQGGVHRATFRCRRCGFERRNRLYPDWADDPDRIELLFPDPTGRSQRG